MTIRTVITPEQYEQVTHIITSALTDDPQEQAHKYVGRILGVLELAAHVSGSAGQAVPIALPQLYKVGDMDPTPTRGPYCDFDKGNLICNWPPGHEHPQHVAGNGLIVLAVW